MAVQRLTDYTRRIWTGLSADAPDLDMQAGDVIYYMDTSTCSIITGIPAPGSIDTKDLPDIGGGGGGGSDLELLTTGTYVLTSNSNKVTIPVTVPPGKIVQRIIADTDVISGTASTYAWFRDYTMPQYVTDLIPRINMAKTNSASNYTAIYGDQVTTSNSTASCYMDDRTTGTNFTVLRVSSGFPCKAGTYRWSLYGGAL